MMGSTTENQNFRVTALGWSFFLRSIPGMLALLFLHEGRLWAAGISMAAASLADLIVGSVERRARWRRQDSDVQIEGFVDFFCFIWVPAQFIMKIAPSRIVIAALCVFILAGMFRLARFNVEGCRDKGYAGLPVSYNGVIFPSIALLASPFGGSPQIAIITVSLLGLSALMASKRFITPKWTI